MLFCDLPARSGFVVSLLVELLAVDTALLQGPGVPTLPLLLLHLFTKLQLARGGGRQAQVVARSNRCLLLQACRRAGTTLVDTPRVRGTWHDAQKYQQ